MQTTYVSLSEMYRIWEKEIHVSMLHGEMRQLAALFLTSKTGGIICANPCEHKIWNRLIEGYSLKNFTVCQCSGAISEDRPLIVDINCNTVNAADIVNHNGRIIILDEIVARNLPFKIFYIRN